MIHIKYAVKGGRKGDPRTIVVPTVVESKRLMRFNNGGRLEQFVIDHGQLIGAEKYMQHCFSCSNLSLLELHDGTGCLAKVI